MKNIKRAITFLIILGIILGLPSIVYLVKNKTVDGYLGQNYYYIGQDDVISTILGSLIFAVIIISTFVIYFKLIKNSDKFKNIKTIMFSILIVGITYLICLPNTSTDVFYYMGTGRLLSEYNINPYSHTVGETLGTDEILNNTGIWKDTTVVYGPIWVGICAFLNKLAFGSITRLLYVFKLAALCLHLMNCFLVYKITKKKKFVNMYGFNPFILLEFLVNVHNDIYILFFVFLAIYFLKNKNNIILSLLSLSLSVSIKYITVLIVPFFIVYYLRNKSMPKKIGYFLLYFLIFGIITSITYLPFMHSIKDLLNSIFLQQSKVKDSIYLIIYTITNSSTIVNYLYSALVFVLMYYYIIFFLKVFFMENTFRIIMKKIYILYIILIFGILTNLTSWYLSWLFIPLFWLKSKDMKTIICLQFLYELTYVYLFYMHSDSYEYNKFIMPAIIVGLLIRFVYIKSKNKKKISSVRE